MLPRYYRQCLAPDYRLPVCMVCGVRGKWRLVEKKTEVSCRGLGSHRVGRKQGGRTLEHRVLQNGLTIDEF